MKLFIVGMLFTSVAFAAPEAQKKVLPVTKAEAQVKKDAATQDKLKALGIEDEDCDEKAKKPVEIKPESISLGGNTGCTLE